jgi:2,4-dienoyl-CoA reductase-like NADH-dependent reductase (Old Yellow Enzyme family)
VGADFPVSVKLNSADFQQGGFTLEESVQVARWLSEAKIDLLELSGGNYERQSMAGIDTPETTRRREAHFLDFAHSLKPVIQMPVMVTGGFRSHGAMIAALQSGDTDMVGIGAPFCVEPDLAAKLLAGTAEGTLLDASQAKVYRDLAIDPAQMTITRGGCYLMTQMINIGQSGRIDDDLTYNTAFAQFGVSEDQKYEALMDFPPVA